MQKKNRAAVTFQTHTAFSSISARRFVSHGAFKLLLPHIYFLFTHFLAPTCYQLSCLLSRNFGEWETFPLIRLPERVVKQVFSSLEAMQLLEVRYFPSHFLSQLLHVA